MASLEGKSADEARLKKRLQTFLGEMLKFGTVKGFKHFSTYMRGREEMVVSIQNELQTASNSYCGSEAVGPGVSANVSTGSSFNSQHLPYDRRSLMLSQRTQMALSGLSDQGVGLPPASPSDEDAHALDETCTVFLIAGYSRYSCPYVWVRSNHSRLVKLTGRDPREKDNPLSLKSTSKWTHTEVGIWDVIAELVKLCTYPSPHNPFAVDTEFLSSQDVSEQVLSTAAIVDLLQKILLHTQDEKPYTSSVFEELQMVTKLHYKALKQLVQLKGLAALTPPSVGGGGIPTHPSRGHNLAPQSQPSRLHGASSFHTYSYQY